MNNKFNKIVDFVVKIPENEDARILQITDLQIVDPGGQRSATRLGNVPAILLSDEEIYRDGFSYIEEAIQKSNPHLILFTGDITYGEFDDDGHLLTKIINFMESFNIPWAPVFGNHDNESRMGVTWQCEQFTKAKNCLFKRNNLTGNGNYSIGIVQNNKLIKVIYMMDTNGCTAAFHDYYGAVDSLENPLTYNQNEKIRIHGGFGDDQVSWLDNASKNVDQTLGYNVSKFLGIHIPIPAFYEALNIYRKDGEPKLFTLGSIVEARDGDFGTIGEYFLPNYPDNGIWNVLQNNHFDGVFAGHDHNNNTSIVFGGIRLTYGLKTGVYDYHRTDLLGGTLIELHQNGKFSVKHLYHE